ncbi:hypothetical protein CROQUDRAFT_54689, partial [Cronartium quercuum f. sp. fusiforme G11]
MFHGQGSGDQWVILEVDLMVGGKTVRAWALVDLGLTGDFISCKFVHQHGFHLLPQPFLLSCSSFYGMPSVDGPITKCWEGRMVLCSNHQAILDKTISLDVTSLGGYDLILGMSWL